MDRFRFLLLVAVLCSAQTTEQSQKSGFAELQQINSKFKNLEAKVAESDKEISTQLQSILALMGLVREKQDKLEKKFDDSFEVNFDCKSLLQQISVLTKQADASQKQFDRVVKIKDEEIRLKEQQILNLERVKIDLQTQLSTKEEEIKTQQISNLESEKNQTSCSALAQAENLKLLSNGKKYYFHPSYANWTFANETCSKKGLHLASIKDQNDAQVVAAEAYKIDPTDAWFVSAKIRASEKDLRWQDGTKLDLDSHLWKDGADKSKDCVWIFNWPKGKLSSATCSHRQPFICQLPSECY
ncbi:C-type lectin domain family 4 member F-like [Neocloeon triangulifer]|uniref:C-type lectin domain family 4 member F-like n=1 Tax=Neocloeon triangulifer TaxID=2078957 RepID=UPI00286EF4C9|nr:C-type lectin domain family 4 member F-like [Neocloeon triangulifer]